MKKTTLTLFLATLALAACSGSSTASLCKQQYWDGTLGVCLPDKWSVVDHETLVQRGLPPEVVTAFQSSVSVAGQNPTVIVTKETLPAPVDPLTYNQASIRSVTSLPSYKQIDLRKVKIDGVSLDLHVFSAQPVPEEPERRYYQMSSTTKGAGYTLTGLTPLSVSSSLESEILAIMQSLTFKDANASSSAK